MKSRKIERKNARKEKKMKRNLYLINKTKSNKCVDNSEENTEKSNEFRDKSELNSNKNKNRAKSREKVRNKRKLSLKVKRDIEREDLEIKRLEKKLKLNKRKKNGLKVTKIPKSFQLDGLDYILDVIDSSNTLKADQPMDETIASEECETQFNSDVNEEEEEDMETNGSDNESADDFDSNHSLSSSEETEEKVENELKEDIYGLIRDSAGNVVKRERDSKEVKPNASKLSEVNDRLLRQIRGQLNRLTVNNMLTISGQMEQMFRENSRHDVNEALFACINTSVIDLDYSSPSKLTTEVSILIAILHTLVGDEVGGHAIHTLITKLDALLQNADQMNGSKRVDNLILVVINLYVCGLIEAQLIYEIITKFCDNFSEKSIELMNLILKSVGFVLRKDSAIKMKELIQEIQNRAKSIDKSSLSGNRITFLLDSLIAIKNNNMSKLKGYGTVVDMDLIQTTLKSTVKKLRVNCIAGSYDAIVGSSHWYSYTQNIEAINSDKHKTNDEKNDKIVDNQINDRLFKALRLNTPLRKTIVMALSTCNDYIDASHRLISIGKKQFSEVINVLIHVSIHENQFNPFYSHLFQHLSKCDRKYKIALDFAIRDKISELESLAPKEQLVLAQLILELLKLNALAITCLKVVHFTDMNDTYVRFIKRILTPILSDEQLIQQILSKIPNKDSFATAIRLFINCFIDPKHRNQLDLKQLKIKQK